jgi:hypothetical protein
MGQPLDDNEVYLAAVEVVEYLNEQGERCFRVTCDGDVPTSTILGLLRVAEHHVLCELSDFGDSGSPSPSSPDGS